MLSQEEKENLEHVSTTVQEADQHHLMPCQVHFCVSDASFLSCKTLHILTCKILDNFDALPPDYVLHSCVAQWLNVSKAEEKERRLASTIESMQASHMLNTTLRSRFGQSVSVTKKSETIAYFANFATRALNPPRLIDAFLQADKEKLEKLLETAKQEVRVPGSRPRNMWCWTRADGVAWSVKAKSQPEISFHFPFTFSSCALVQDLGKWSMVFVF